MVADKKSILIVDDEEDLTWSISRYLKKNDAIFQVRCVSNGEQALRHLESECIDLMISDIRMPGISGLELLRYVQSHCPQTRVIIMTAFGSEVLEQQITRMGSPYYIEKPFELAVLRELIYSALQLSEKKIEKSILNTRIKEIIAFHCRSGRTSQLMLQHGLHQGMICFKQGEIVHAECGELEGETALLSILDWGGVDSYSQHNHISQKRTIRRNWQSLLNSTMID